MVKQGKVQEMTVMSDAQRLDLMRQEVKNRHTEALQREISWGVFKAREKNF